MKIHPLVNHERNLFCGPAVISFLTGLTTEDASLLLRKYRKLFWSDNGLSQRQVTSTYPEEVLTVLDRCGIGNTEIYNSSYARGKVLTYGEWLDTFNRGRKTYLLMISSHWVLVRGNFHACSLANNKTGGVRLTHPDVVKQLGSVVQMVYELRTLDKRKVRRVHDNLETQKKYQRLERVYDRLVKGNTANAIALRSNCQV